MPLLNKQLNSTKPASQILFSIDLKVSGQIITLNVQQNDSVDILLNKHQCLRNQKNQIKLLKIKTKVIQSIEKQIQIKLKQKNYQLVSKLEQFLDNSAGNLEIIENNDKNQPRKDYNNNDLQVINQQTPFKRLLVTNNKQNKQQNKNNLIDQNKTQQLNSIHTKNKQKNQTTQR